MGRRTALVAALAAVVAAIALVAWVARRGEPSGKFEVQPGCSKPATRTPSRDRRGSDLVSVSGRERQAITGWGASVVSDTFIDPLVDTGGLSPGQIRELDRLVFAEAGIDIVRVFGPGFGRARVSAPARARVRDRSFAFMRRVSSNGVRFMYTGADAPAELKDGRRLLAGGERPLARYVAGYLRFARDAVGVGFDYAAIANEPDNRSSRLTMTPEQSARVYSELANELDRQGMDTQLVLGDTTGWGTACPYASAQLATPDARAGAVAFASHPYFGSGDEARAVGEQARRAGVEVWQTEYGTGCATCPEDDSIHRAIGWSRKIVSDLTKPQVSAWFAFRAVADSTHGPGDALLVRVRGDRRRPFFATRRFYVVRQYTSVAPRGARRLEVGERVPGVLTVAFRTGERVAAVVTNTSRRSRPIRLDLGPRGGRLDVRRTSFRERFAPIAPLAYRGRPLRLVLPPESVTTYALTLAEVTGGVGVAMRTTAAARVASLTSLRSGARTRAPRAGPTPPSGRPFR